MSSNIKVVIIDRPYKVAGETIHAFTGWCSTCLREVSGPTGVTVWQSKPPALKAAKAHIERHPALESWIDRVTADGRGKVVTVVNSNDQ